MINAKTLWIQPAKTPAIELTIEEIALAVACLRLQLATLESQGAHSDTRYLAQARDIEALIAKLEGSR